MREGIGLDQEVKICSCCSTEKVLEYFVKHSRICRDCRNEKQRVKRRQNGDAATKKYEKTKKGFLMRSYRNMLSRVTGVQSKKAHLYEGLDVLSKEQFYEWALANEDFHELFEEYEKSDYDMRLAPSVDREDSSKGYNLDNMRWLPHWKNSQLGSLSRRNK